MNESKPRGRLSEYLRQNALALVALFFGLTGGVGWATHPGGANTIDSADIINGEVTVADLGPDTVTTNKVVDDQLRSVDVRNESLLSEDILDGTIGGSDIANNGVLGADIDESTLGTVPRAQDANQASSAQNAIIANTAISTRYLDFRRAYINSNSVVVPGGSQDDGNGNGNSREVFVRCNVGPSFLPDIALGGGAFWSGNPNSNSNTLENRIHSAAFLGENGQPATSGLPVGYRVRGEVDKDGNDTLTVQVACYPGT